MTRELQQVRMQLAAAEERERDAKSAAGQEHAKAAALQEKLAAARKDIARLQAELLEQTQRWGQGECVRAQLPLKAWPYPTFPKAGREGARVV